MPHPLEVGVLLPAELAPHAVTYLTGSHACGLNTPVSDFDYTVIYLDRPDLKRVFRKYPDALHSKVKGTGADESQKGYALKRFAQLLAKGDANLAELADHLRVVGGWEQNHDTVAIQRFMTTVSPFLVTRELVGSYLGHLTGIHHEMRTKGVTPKRLSHALRMADGAIFLLEQRRVPDYRSAEFAEQRALALAVKTGVQTLADGAAALADREGVIQALKGQRDNFPDNHELVDTINDFFVHLS
ncbi:hypothetical protein GCM10022631_11020 [Deinococcus rubellus]|uniref:DNA polymerase beta superfamily protein n=1 Tax=Deinococcus rubellus TaxID=1889240 RepID=UPI0031EAD7C8